MTDIVVPELGESVVEATVARWLKKEGDPVSVGEPVVALETDKVDLEVGAKEEGTLAQILHQEGDDVKVGEILGVIQAGSQPGQKTEGGSTSQPQTAETASAPDQPVSKTRTEQSGSEDESNQVVDEGDAQPARTEERVRTERATPVALRLAESEGVEIGQIQPKSPGERITKEDVERYLQQSKQKPVQTPQPPAAQPGTVDQQAVAQPVEDGALRREVRERMSRRRRTIASRLVEAQQTAAMLTTFNDVDMSAVMDIRKRRRDSFQERNGVKLGFMSFFVKAAIGALKEFPRVNAEIQGEELVLKYYYDIGIAVGAEEGLVVPVLRNADRMTFAEIEKKIQELSGKVNDGTLSVEDLRGGTFTITNGGIFGSLLSTPILNPPQVGILGMHRIEERPVAVNGQIALRQMMYLALSYDHRIVDGREAVQFLVRIKELIEDPETLLLEG